MSCGAIVIAVFLKRTCVEVVGAPQLRVDGERFLQDLARAGRVALLKQGAANVSPAVRILRIGFGDFLKGRGGSFQIALQEQANAVIVPAGPILFGRDSLWLRRESRSRKNAQCLGVLRDDSDREIGNRFEVTGDTRGVAVERPFAVVVVRRSRGGRCACIRRSTWFALCGFFRFDARKGEMRIEPAELAIVELGVERNFVARIFGNVKTEVCCIRGTRRDQMDVHDRASGPGVALVDGIAVAIDLQRTIEVRSRFDGTFTVVLDFSAPEEYLAFFISRLQLEPDLEGVHRATWEKVADFAGTHDHVHAGVIAAAHGRVSAIDRSRNWADFAGGALG